MTRFAVASLVVCLFATGCQTPQQRLNAPPHGTTNNPSRLQSMYTHMVDNALLEDMTVCDHHFLPHRAQLNALGEERLARLATLMEMYGGTIRFSSDVTDETLIAERTATVMDYLAGAGVDVTHEVLVRDLPGGEGMGAEEAILIKVNEGTYTPGKARGGSTELSGSAK